MHHEFAGGERGDNRGTQCPEQKGAVGVHPTALFIFVFANTFVARAPSALISRAVFLAAAVS